MKNVLIKIAVVIAVLVWVYAPAQGAEFFVSPTGTPQRDGSKQWPWDLQTALNQSTSIIPGDIIYLRGGVYNGQYSSKLSGSPGNPITVRSYPGEWAKLDGYVSGVLASPVTTADRSITLVDASHFPNLYSGTMLASVGVIDPSSPTGFQGVESMSLDSTQILH